MNLTIYVANSLRGAEYSLLREAMSLADELGLAISVKPREPSDDRNKGVLVDAAAVAGAAAAIGQFVWAIVQRTLDRQERVRAEVRGGAAGLVTIVVVNEADRDAVVQEIARQDVDDVALTIGDLGE